MSENVLCVVRTSDLMAEVRVLEALSADGLAAKAANPETWATEMAAAAPGPADLVQLMKVGIVDLTAPDALTAIELALASGVPVIAYGPHVDEQTMAAARAAGANAVYPRGRFLMQTAALVRELVSLQGAESG